MECGSSSCPATHPEDPGCFFFIIFIIIHANNKAQSSSSLLFPPLFVLLSQVSAEPEGGSYVFQGSVQGKDYGRFGLQRVGRCDATGRPTPCRLICLNHFVTGDVHQMHAPPRHRVSSATRAPASNRGAGSVVLTAGRRSRAAPLTAAATANTVEDSVAVLHFHVVFFFFLVCVCVRAALHIPDVIVSPAFRKITAAIIIRAIISASPLSASSWVFSASHHRHHRPLHYRHRRQQMIRITIFLFIRLSHFVDPTPISSTLATFQVFSLFCWLNPPSPHLPGLSVRENVTVADPEVNGSTNSSSVAVAILVPFFALIFAGLGFYLYKQRYVAKGIKQTLSFYVWSF